MDHFSTRRRALEIKIAKTIMGGYTCVSSLITKFRESGGSPTAWVMHMWIGVVYVHIFHLI